MVEGVIPPQLNNPSFRFILVDRGAKNPKEVAWQKKNNYRFDDPKLLEHLNKGGNYGVVTGYGGLTVLDIDDEGIYNKLRDILPPTFVVATGSGKEYKKHYYYLTEAHSDSFKVLDTEKNTLVDVQSKGKQVIGPGSLHSSGGYYKVVDDVPISELSMAEINALLTPWMDQKEEKTTNAGWQRPRDPLLDEIKKRISIKTLLDSYGVNTSKNPTGCPLHTSKGGKCLSFDDSQGLWKCFHCGKGGDIFNLVMENDNVKFKQAMEKLAEQAGVSLSERHYTIPKPTVCWTEMITDSRGNDKIVIHYKELVKEYRKIQPFFYDSKTDILWWWIDSQYKRTHMACIVDDIDQKFDIPLKNDTVNNNHRCYVQAIYQVGQEKRPLDVPKQWVYFKNTVFDLKDGSVQRPTPTHFFSSPIPWRVGEKSDTPSFDKIVSEWIGAKNVPLFYEICAYCCLRDYPIPAIFVFLGGGSNGKTAATMLIKRFVGAENYSAADLNKLLKGSFETAMLYRKLACFINETNFSVMESTDALKRLTGGGDPIKFEFKNKDPFTENNYAKIIISTNSLPQTEDRSDGFFRRMFLIDFPNQFDGKTDVFAGIPDSEFEALAAKCLVILPKLLKERKFYGEGTIAQKTAMYEDASDPLRRFIRESCDMGDLDVYVLKWEFRDLFFDWQVKNRYRRWSETELGREMGKKGYETHKVSVEVPVEVPGTLVKEMAQKQYRAWFGLKFKDAVSSLGTGYPGYPHTLSSNANVVQYVKTLQSDLKRVDIMDIMDISEDTPSVIVEEVVSESVPVHLKCYICGDSPCHGYDNSHTGKGRPICNDCKTTTKKDVR